MTIGLAASLIVLNALDEVITGEHKDQYSEQLWVMIHQWPAAYVLVMILCWPVFFVILLLPNGDKK
jgi:hypothetical protein